jgi:hypothetical protein
MSTTCIDPSEDAIREIRFCSIVVDREHEHEFAQEISEHADKRYLTWAVERWRQERSYAYMMVLESEADVAAVTFVTKRTFAETLVETLTRVAGASCLWVLLISEPNRQVFQQVLDADNETETGHLLN